MPSLFYSNSYAREFRSSARVPRRLSDDLGEHVSKSHEYGLLVEIIITESRWI
jgi:hypothetical protein